MVVSWPPASETGHTVVYTGMVSVTRTVDSAGQLVTVGAQEVIVRTVVAKTVEVVISVVGRAKTVLLTPLLTSVVGRAKTVLLTPLLTLLVVLA